MNSAAITSANTSQVERSPAKSDLVLIVANPRAGAGNSAATIRRLVAAIQNHGLQAEVISDLAVLSDIAAQAQAEDRLRAVVAGGGDGTLAEVVNRTTPDAPLAVFPLGTANLLANHLGIRARPDEFAAMLAGGASVRMDAGRVTWLDVSPKHADSAGAEIAGAGQGGDGEAAGSVAASAGVSEKAKSRIFLTVAGVGFDAAVVERLHRGRTGNIQFWSYVKPILDSLRTYAYPALRYECAVGSGTQNCPTEPQRIEQHVARWLFVQNVPRYAGGLNFVPQAAGSDGLLDVCAFEHGSLWNGLRYASRVWLGSHHRMADCRVVRTPRLRVTADVPVLVELDGDPGGQLPVDIEVLPARVRLIVPSAAVGRL